MSGCGCSSGGSAPRWMTAPIQEVAQYSPLLALARAWRVPFAPFVLSCRATFASANVTVLPNVSLENGQGRITQISVVDSLKFSVQQPASFPGNIFKNQSDDEFKQNSGISAKINVDGAPRYAVAPFFTPIETLADVIGNAPAWPMGWILTYTQTIQMEFQAEIPLPSLPTTIIASYRLWQPYGTDEFVSMSNGQAFTQLFKLYANDADMTAALNMAQNAPVGR
jgi:hypothetical protein